MNDDADEFENLADDSEFASVIESLDLVLNDRLSSAGISAGKKRKSTK
jgi:hypothetical protein